MDEVALVREKIDLVALIGETVQLKKAGKNFKGLCPFHGEKSPSFIVSPDRQIWHCFGCFPPGEKIKTPFGLHAIEDITAHEYVISGQGNLQKVTETMGHQYEGTLVSVTLQRLRETVRITSDHNVFIVRPTQYMQKHYKSFSQRYKKYLTLREKDKAQYDHKMEKYFPIKKIPAGDLQEGDFMLYPIRTIVTDVPSLNLEEYITRHTKLGPIPRNIPLRVPVSEELLKLIGYYIAEGSSHRAYIRFSLGNHEEAFAQEIVGLVKTVFHLDTKIYRRQDGTRKGLEVTACHAVVANIFENLCGKGAAEKHIPFTLQELPFNKQRVLLNAIHKGDGTSFYAHKSTKLHKSITTISTTLIDQLRDILLRLNYYPGLHVRNMHIDKNKTIHRKSYAIFWSEEAYQKYSAVYYTRAGNMYWLLPVTLLEKEAYRGPVYNFTVEEDHSYVANHFAVANCQRGGTVFDFVMEQEHIEFGEALRILAKRAGVTLQSRGANAGLSEKKERLYQLNNLAMEFYHYILTKHKAGKTALEYVKGRKINEKVIETFKLGFAPHQRDALTTFLIKKKHFSPEELIEAGIATQSGRQFVDFFWNRLMFPLYDHRENVVGFSGRILEENARGPKYINTKETLIYHKGETFYGIQVTKDAIQKTKQAILVEGEFDVISCFQAGIPNVLAVKGTALTPMQVTLLSRYAEKITICFDGDHAGQDAIKRSIPIIDKKNLQTTVVIIPGSKDPDEALKTNELAFKQALKHDVSVYDYLFDQAIASADAKTAEGKRLIADSFLPTLASIENAIIREHYVKKLSTIIDTSYENLTREIERLGRPVQVKEGVVAEVEKRSREEILEEYLTSLILQSDDPKKAVETSVQILAGSMGKERAYQKIIFQLIDFFQAFQKAFDHTSFSAQLPSELHPMYNKSLLFPLPKLTPEAFLEETRKTALQLRELYLRTKIKQLSELIKQKEKEGDSEAVHSLQISFNEAAKLLQEKSTA